MSLDAARGTEIQQVFNVFFDGLTTKHGGGVVREILAAQLIAASNLTLAYYTKPADNSDVVKALKSLEAATARNF